MDMGVKFVSVLCVCMCVLCFYMARIVSVEKTLGVHADGREGRRSLLSQSFRNITMFQIKYENG